MAGSRARLSDIASEAGVSQATVSRVFNQSGKVKDETRLRVVEATRRLGFGLPALQTLGLIVPDASNPFFSQLIYYFESELGRHGAQVVSASSNGQTDREIEIIERFRGMGVEGILYTPSRSSGEAIVELVSRGDVPVLAFDRPIATGNLDCVTTASRSATQMMVDYLYNLGHRRFAYIKGAEDTATAEDRYEAFVDGLARNQVSLAAEMTYSGNYRFSAGRDYGEVYLRLPELERPTAVVAANDVMAIGFMQRVQEAGLRVPYDVSVAGFDGIEYGMWYSPSLTTIVQPVRRLVREATRLLLERIDHVRQGSAVPAPRTVPVEPRFVVRNSVGPVPSPQGLRASMHVVNDLDSF